jgi:hypothetical protein
MVEFRASFVILIIQNLTHASLRLHISSIGVVEEAVVVPGAEALLLAVGTAISCACRENQLHKVKKTLYFHQDKK